MSAGRVTCDWGICGRPAIAWRRDETGIKVPVCALHEHPNYFTTFPESEAAGPLGTYTDERGER